MTDTATNRAPWRSAAPGLAAGVVLGAWLAASLSAAAGSTALALAGGAVVVGLVGGWCLRARGRDRARRALAAGAALTAIALAEGAGWLLAGWQAGPAFAAVSAGAVRYDPDRGFRWAPGTYRSVRVGPAGVSYDARFSINAQGWWSSRDYADPSQPASAEPGIVVFGDSFTAASYLDRSWPDALHDSRPASAPAVRSYAQDGAGLANWHRVFLREVVASPPRGLILACYIDSLHRTPTILHGDDDQLWFMRFRRFPRDAEEFVGAFRPHMQPIARVLDEPALDAAVAAAGSWSRPPARLHVAERCGQILRGVWAPEEPRGLQFADVQTAPRTLPRGELEARLGSAWPLLNELLDRCRSAGVPVLLCAIPSREGALAWSQAPAGSLTVHQEELRSIAAGFGLDYFDGYELFRGASPAQVRAAYLTGDAHWTQATSDRFAAALEVWLTQEGWPR